MLTTFLNDPLVFVTRYRTPLFAITALGGGAIAGLVAWVLNDPVLLFAGFFAALAGGLTFLRIEYGLLTLLFITYIRLSDVLVQHHGAPSVAKFFVPVLLGFVLVRWVMFQRPIAPWLKIALLLGAYGLLGFASILYAKNPNLTERMVSDFAKDALIAVVIVMILFRGVSMRRAMWALIAAGIFLGTLTTYQFLTGTFDNNYWGFAQADVRQITTGSADYRIAGPISSNYYALVMVALVPIALDRLWHEPSYILRLVAGYGALVTILSVIFTYSRGGFVALVVVIGLMLLYKKLNPAYMLIGILGGLLILPFLPAQYTDRMATLTGILPAEGDDGMVPTDSSFRGRLSE
ncbi:MAG: hypothetical protein KDD89_05215, partial [Anaerolineales bacterium]|nr:hypothetical protein [Anaerolineales bacterium]